MPSAPAENMFPAYPAAWYLFGESRRLKNRPISKRMLGRRLVAYRGASGQAVVLDGTCSHLGADLGRGEIVGDCVRCPFHHWEYATDGHCVRIPTQESIPVFARQRAYPCVERHGLLFFFNGEEPLFPLPFFVGEHPESFMAGRKFDFVADCSWFMLTGNGFDTAHFQSVHDRKLLCTPVVDLPHEYARRITFRTRVMGASVADRFIRRTIGDVAEVTISNWGGPLVAVTGRFARATSYMLIMTQPLEAQTTLVEVVVYAPLAANAFVRRALQPAALEIRRWLTQAFLFDDIKRLPGIRYSARSLVRSDRELIDFFRWLTALPQSKQELQCSDSTTGEPTRSLTEGVVR